MREQQMNNPIPSNIQEELVQEELSQEEPLQLDPENKKRKVRIVFNRLKTDIMNYFKV